VDLVFYLLAIGMGIITGGITSLIGASGVMIIVPILTMVFNVSIHTAIGTSLFVDVIASLTVAYTYYKNGNIELKSGVWITLTSIIGAQFGAFYANRLGEGNLTSSFGIVLVAVGLFMIRNSFKKNRPSADALNKSIRFKKEWQKTLAALMTGLVVGIISGIFGAGGGVMILIALIAIMSFQLHKAIGTSTLIMALTALSSTVGYAARGNIDLVLGSLLATGAVMGGIAGSRYANRINEKTLQKVVGICFLVMGVVMTALQIIK